MTASLTILVDFDGKTFTPAGDVWLKRARDAFDAGERYRLEFRESRSENSHRHYHAALDEIWMNLPDNLAERWPTPDAMRKWLLIKCGFRNETLHVCADKAEARKLVAFIRPIDNQAVVIARDNVVIVWTARSQSYRAMPTKDEFQRSKSAVLDAAAALLKIAAIEAEDHARTL